MSVPPELLAHLQRGPGPMMPAAAPMANPAHAEGLKAVAKVTVEIAMKLLEHAMPHLGAASPEGESVLSSLKTLSRHFKMGDNQDLVPAELMHLMAGAGPRPPMPPGAGGPPGAPPGMPPGMHPVAPVPPPGA